MAAAPTLVSLDEYLNTAYEPDRDFVDGVLLERNVGTQRHSLLQTFLILFFGQYIKSHRIALFTDRKSTRLNSSHLGISYAVFCLKKKKNNNTQLQAGTAAPLETHTHVNGPCP